MHLCFQVGTEEHAIRTSHYDQNFYPILSVTMTSNECINHEIDSTHAPDLLAHYPPYLAAFNEHSWPKILEYVSPTCHATFRGKLAGTSAEDMRPNYEKDFDRCEKHEVAIKEMKPIERSVDESVDEEEWKKGIRWGLKLVLYDPTMGRTITVNYWYRRENGKWMQCWHEILDSIADGTL
jgi:hypothetical protein